MPRIKKQRNTKVGKTTAYALNKKGYGSEPTFDGVPSNTDLIRAFTWYNYMMERKEGFEYLKEYVKDSKFAKQIGFVKDTFNTTMYAVARMLNNGIELPESNVEKLNLAIADNIKTNKAPKPETVSRNMAKLDDETDLDRMVADVDEAIDNGNYDFDIYKVMAERNLKKVDADRLKAHYEPLLEELREAKAGKDSQLKEAYSNVKTRELNKRIKFFDSLFGSVETHKENKTKTRKPRKVSKAKKIESTFRHFKCKDRDDDFKIVSINPETVLNASEVWAFDTKYQKLMHYVAHEGGFGIHRTALTNIDENATKGKRIGRKANKILEKFKSLRKNQLSKFLDSIKADDLEISNRINENIVLLKAI